MKRLIRCEFNMDTARVELRYSGGSLLAIDFTFQYLPPLNTNDLS